jgi:glycine dehydrogenase subunit 2
MHLNLHKTFSIPHGGGGAGAGPVGVAAHLVPFLPVPVVRAAGYEEASPLRPSDDLTFALDFERPASNRTMRSFWSNFAHMVRALAYCYANGAEGLTKVSQLAVLNANYIRASIRDLIDIPYDEINRHEFVASAQSIKRESGVRALDIGKALLDRGYHAPTVYFPLLVPECIMIEPTETESKETLDGFIAALREILIAAREAPQTILDAPVNTPVSRVDETRAARSPDLRWRPAPT